MLFLCLAIAFFVVVGVPQLAFMVQRRRLHKRDWSAVLASIEPINLAGVMVIAEMYLSPTKNQLSIEPPEMWEMLGGIEGIERLAANANAMLELCVIAESWDHDGLLISEMIRCDLANLKKALVRLERATLLGYADARGHFALMELAASYNLIRLRLLGQYEKFHVARLHILQEQLGT